MGLNIRFFQVMCGDAIKISMASETGIKKNILIDGGFLGSYFKILKDEINQLSKDENIDLWVLTHLDADHINGAIGFFRYANIIQLTKLKRVWFNFYDDLSIPNDSNLVSFGKAIELRNKLKEFNLEELNQKVTAGLIFKIGDAKITVLSPDLDTYQQLGNDWNNYEMQFKKPIPSVSVSSTIDNDDKLTIGELAQRKNSVEEKQDIINRSSIAFLFEYEQKVILFLGDSHSSVITSALKKLQEGGEKIKIDYIKLSHHGSKKNFNNDIFNFIECNNFIISSNGENQHGIPNKEVLAKIIYRPNLKEQLNLFFNYDCARYRNMFVVDDKIDINYNFKCIFPEKGLNYLDIKL